MSRIGLLVPSSNTTVEPEFYRALPSGVSLHTARLYLTQIAPEAIAEMVRDIAVQAKLLASAEVDVIVLGATAPSFLKGLGYDKNIIAEIEKATGIAATTTSTALIQAIQFIGAKRVVLGAAYDDKVNAIAKSFMEASGITVLDAQGLGYVDNLKVGRLEAQTAYDLACKVDCPEAEAIVLACTNWKTMDVIDRIEQKTGKPVVTTTQASIWACLRMIGGANVQGFWQLLRDISAPATASH